MILPPMTFTLLRIILALHVSERLAQDDSAFVASIGAVRVELSFYYNGRLEYFDARWHGAGFVGPVVGFYPNGRLAELSFWTNQRIWFGVYCDPDGRVS